MVQNAEALKLAEENRILATKTQIVNSANEMMARIFRGDLISREEFEQAVAFEKDQLSQILPADYARIPVQDVKKTVDKFVDLIKALRLSFLELPYTHPYFYDAKNKKVIGVNSNTFYESIARIVQPLNKGKLFTAQELRQQVADYFASLHKVSHAPLWVETLILNALFDYNQSCLQVQTEVTRDICSILFNGISKLKGKAETIQKDLQEVSRLLEAALKSGRLITTLPDVKQLFITCLSKQMEAALALCNPLKTCSAAELFQESLKRLSTDFKALKRDNEKMYIARMDQIYHGLTLLLTSDDNEVKAIIAQAVPNQEPITDIQHLFELVKGTNQYISTVDEAKGMVETVYILSNLEGSRRSYFRERLEGHLPLSLPEIYALCEILKINLVMKHKIGEQYVSDERIKAYLPKENKDYPPCVIEFDETGFEPQMNTVALAAQKVVEKKEMEVEKKEGEKRGKKNKLDDEKIPAAQTPNEPPLKREKK